MLHISDLKRFQFCQSYYHYSQEEYTNPFLSFFPSEIDINQLLRERLKIHNYFQGKVGDDKTKAFEALNSYKWLVDARFEAHGLRNKVPLLKVTKSGVRLYYFYKGALPRKHLKFHLSSLYFLLKENGLNVIGITILHLNQAYVLEDELDLKELISETKYFYNKNGNLEKTTIFKQIKNSNLEKIKRLIAEINNFQFQPLTEMVARKCFVSGVCPYFKKCFPDIELSDNSLLYLHGSSKKYDLYNAGYLTFSDYLKTDEPLTKATFAQIKADQNNGLYFESLPIKMWLNNLKYPLSFLDFEWETIFVPTKKGTSPFDPQLFQYSLHVLDKELRHYDFLRVEVDEAEFLENLLKVIPEKGSIITFNGNGAEVTRLKELSSRYLEYQADLLNIINRVVDIGSIFNEGYLYHLKMKGSYSLTSIVEAFFPDETYDNLVVNDGYQAVLLWRKLKGLPEPKQVEAISNLKEYCQNDTYVLYLLYEYLRNLVK